MITLRPVAEEDIEAFFEHQADEQASAMAAFPSRDRPSHFAHWAKILANADNVTRTVVVDGQVAGNVGSWVDEGRRYVGYWIGREFWGRGVATVALGNFVAEVIERPIYAFVAVSNVGSVRVLEKNGFRVANPQPPPHLDDDVEERLYVLAR